MLLGFLCFFRLSKDLKNSDLSKALVFFPNLPQTPNIIIIIKKTVLVHHHRYYLFIYFITISI